MGVQVGKLADAVNLTEAGAAGIYINPHGYGMVGWNSSTTTAIALHNGTAAFVLQHILWHIVCVHAQCMTWSRCTECIAWPWMGSQSPETAGFLGMPGPLPTAQHAGTCTHKVLVSYGQFVLFFEAMHTSCYTVATWGGDFQRCRHHLRLPSSGACVAADWPIVRFLRSSKPTSHGYDDVTMFMQ